MSEGRGGRGTVAAFIQVGEPMPAPALYDGVREFQHHAGAYARDWILNLRVVAGGKEDSSSVGSIQAEEVGRLADRLRGAGLLEAGAFSVSAQERAPEEKPRGFEIKPRLTWRGRSHEFALSLAMAAAQRGLSLPSWAAFTASLDRDARLLPPRRVARKAAIASGRVAGADHLARVARAMAEADGRKGQVLPGGVRLLLAGCLSADAPSLLDRLPDRDEAALRRWFRVSRPMTVPSCRFRGFGPDDVRDWYEDHEGGLWLGLAQDLPHAFAYLGLEAGGDRPPPLVLYRLRPGGQRRRWRGRRFYLRAMAATAYDTSPTAPSEPARPWDSR
ncbi:MAG: hypothetical protein K2X91_06985, partial [Thermoleophilia bacterium]|nr:hypothetical protein [Thermoleophilia bacterium]